MYLYESHLGGYYISEDEIPYEDLYCETCGDYVILYAPIMQLEKH